MKMFKKYLLTVLAALSIATSTSAIEISNENQNTRTQVSINVQNPNRVSGVLFYRKFYAGDEYAGIAEMEVTEETSTMVVSEGTFREPETYDNRCHGRMLLKVWKNGRVATVVWYYDGSIVGVCDLAGEIVEVRELRY